MEVKKVGLLFSFRSTTKSSQTHSVAFTRAGVLGKGDVGSCLLGTEFQFCKMERVLKIGCITM